MKVKVRVTYEFEVNDGLYQETLDGFKEELTEMLNHIDYLGCGIGYNPTLIYVSAIEIPGNTFGRPFGATGP